MENPQVGSRGSVSPGICFPPGKTTSAFYCIFRSGAEQIMKNLFLLFVSLIFFAGCSLKYGTNYQDEDNVPEFVFTDANYSRYENNQKTLNLSASRLEQYSDGKSMYAKDVDFQVMDKEGNLLTQGSCALLSSNTDTEEYTLYDNIEIENKKDDIKVSADTLRWNGKTEQLTSSRNDTVTIKKGNTTIQGSGFSASGVSKKFLFNGVVTGQYISDEDGEQIEENQ